MSIRLTRIYTKTGDTGTTALGNGMRVHKTDIRVAAYADVDETNAAIGVALALGELALNIREPLSQIQNDLFDVGADLCTPITDASASALRVTDQQVTHLEKWCDEFNAELSTLKSFLLPGGTPGAALLHQARTVARRAERTTWALREAEPDTTHEIPSRYLNRLSDLLFILARVANPSGDVLWQPGAGQSEAGQSGAE